MSLRTELSMAGARLIEISGAIGGMVVYAGRPQEELIGIHYLHDLRRMHMELGLALDRFEAAHPEEVRRSRFVNSGPKQAKQPVPSPETAP